MIDESLRIYIILRTPYQDEATLKSYLTRLAVNLDIQARGSPLRSPGGHDTPRETPSRTEDTLWTGNIDTSEDPFIVVQEEEEHDSTRTILAIWTVKALLSE